MGAKQTYEDLIGKTFHQLTVTGLADRRSSGEQLFYCDCTCGTKNHKASKHQLVANKIKSCGCLREDQETIIGIKYNRLTVVSKAGRQESNQVQLFLCKCDCGGQLITTKRKLQDGQVKSCGCLLQTIRDKYADLIGQRFGKLLVTKKLGTITSRRDIYWECKCDCGNTIQVTTGNLTFGHNQGCGCVNLDNIKAYRISKGKDPDVSMRSDRERLRTKLSKSGLIKTILARDKFRCVLCGASGKLHVHHIIPLAVNESLVETKENLVTLCKECHFVKAHQSDYHKTDIAIQTQLLTITGLQVGA